MGKKKAAAPEFTRPKVPGRFVMGYRSDESGVHDAERVELEMTAERLKLVTDEMKLLRVEMDKKALKVKEARQALATDTGRHNALVRAIETGLLEEHRDVFVVADDEAERVAIYDARTHELLQTREMNYYERQVDMEPGEDDE